MLDASWWDQRVLEWAMANEQLKIRLFRFIDVLPALPTGAQVARHLHEYFGRDGAGLPAGLRMGLNFTSPTSLAARLAAMAARKNALRMARTFIAGSNAEEAIRTVQRLRKQRTAFTVDVLGEATTSHTEADRYMQTYLDLLAAMGPAASEWSAVEQIDTGPDGPLSRVNVSVKLSSLDPHFDPIDPHGSSEIVLGRLRPILRRARECGAFVNIDMEQQSYKDLSLAIFQDVLGEDEFRDYRDVGIVIQTYLRSAEEDLRGLVEWVRRRGTPITVRLVKGAYWDYEVVRAIQNHWPYSVFTEKWRSDATYEQLTRVLMDNHNLVRPAFASHNVRSLAVAIAEAEARGLRPCDYELQMLFGMGDPLKGALVEMDQRLRVYAPYGELIPGMAYLIRRLLENTSNESFLRQGFSENTPVETLLADPQETQPASTPPPAPVFSNPDEESDMEPFENVPDTDFSVEANRDKMVDALTAVRRQFGLEYPLLVDGETVATGEWIESVNPACPTEIVGRVAAARAEDVDRFVATAREAFEGWRSTAPAQRAALLNDVADQMVERRFELAALAVYEVGKPWREADAGISEAIDFCRFYGREIERLSARPRRRDFPGEDNRYTYEPRGVVAVVAPWNFPLAILTGMTAAALAAGNTVIMKPAEQSSVIAALLMEMLEKARIPSGVAQFLPGVGETVGRALVEHPGVNLVAFTGSREVGCAIYESAAKLGPGQRGLKKVIAEMGGKNATIIDDDADLDEAVAGVIGSAFGYAGQKCSAGSRAVVHTAVHDTFVRRLVDAAASLRIGPPEAPGTMMGPVIDADALAKVRRYVDLGKDEATLALEVDVSGIDGGGYYVGPTVFTDVPPDARIAQEEIFGPVLAVIRAESFDHALEIANGTAYALTGGVYSRSPAHLEQAKREFRVGNLYINRKITGAIVDRQPFGGFKMSGIGSKAGGPDYLEQYMEPRTITENTLRHGFAPVGDAE